jgi:hypothetical protein
MADKSMNVAYTNMEKTIDVWMATRAAFMQQSPATAKRSVFDDYTEANMQLFYAFSYDWRDTSGYNLLAAFRFFRQSLIEQFEQLNPHLRLENLEIGQAHINPPRDRH